MINTEFKPKTITVAKGETIRFVVLNKGELVHEFNTGTAAMHHEHQKEMLKMADQGILEADRINHEMMKSGSGHKQGHTMTHDDPTACSSNQENRLKSCGRSVQARRCKWRATYPGTTRPEWSAKSISTSRTRISTGRPPARKQARADSALDLQNAVLGEVLHFVDVHDPLSL